MRGTDNIFHFLGFTLLTYYSSSSVSTFPAPDPQFQSLLLVNVFISRLCTGPSTPTLTARQNHLQSFLLGLINLDRRQSSTPSSAASKPAPQLFPLTGPALAPPLISQAFFNVLSNPPYTSHSTDISIPRQNVFYLFLHRPHYLWTSSQLRRVREHKQILSAFLVLTVHPPLVNVFQLGAQLYLINPPSDVGTLTLGLK